MWTNNAFRIVIKTLVVPNFPSPAMLVVTKPCALSARFSACFVGARKPRKNSGSHIDASHSRQPLVKGERLVRYEVNAVMLGP